ncbi:MAG: oxygen-independent coproporphyrinogen III oxidase [Tenuifilaceae bacterium]|jgi:oxygen-independent coproporphyrinogen-3 oxidase|nr:oxygen-independent coproporphyrinogen III oxidase [Tenuifilaceae bacterium]
MELISIPEDLFNKYNLAVPRYTSYPPANFFHDGFAEKDLVAAIESSNSKGLSNISLYIHIPFCPQKCLYCGCNTHITKDPTLISEYIDALKKEVDVVSKLIDSSRKVTQIHFGGGSPTSLNDSNIEDILSVLKTSFSLSPIAELAIECHPADLTPERIDYLANLGFNRFSLGVQDFNQTVLDAVRRRVPELDIAEIVTQIRKHKGISVNLDLIYGLPLQNISNFAYTINQALAIKPDRLVTFSYAHLPNVNPNQQSLKRFPIPTPKQKSELFEFAYQTITKAGYQAIGFDHFALPTDELSLAQEAHELHRNFQGYCTRRTTGQVLAFGASAISQLHTAYAQNTKDVKEYISTMTRGVIPVSKGYRLSNQEVITREIITQLMCNFKVNWSHMAKQFETGSNDLRHLIHINSELLKQLKADKLIIVDSDSVGVTSLGRFFIRHIASAFDPLNKSGKTFSQNF